MLTEELSSFVTVTVASVSLSLERFKSETVALGTVTGTPFSSHL